MMIDNVRIFRNSLFDLGVIGDDMMNEQALHELALVLALPYIPEADADGAIKVFRDYYEDFTEGGIDQLTFSVVMHKFADVCC